MADKGFNVEDIFAPLDVSLNISTLLLKRNRFTAESRQKDSIHENKHGENY